MRRILLCLSCILLAGCAPYYGPVHKPGFWWMPGYSETRLSPRIYQVRYRSLEDSSTSIIRILFNVPAPSNSDLVLLRSADLALERGYRYFLVDTAAVSEYSVELSPNGDTSTVRSLIMKVFHELPEVEGSQPYDAVSVRRKTEKRYAHLADTRTETSPIFRPMLLPGKGGQESLAAVSALALPTISLDVRDEVGSSYSEHGSSAFQHFLLEHLSARGFENRPNDATLAVEVTVTKLDPGSRLKRLIIGFGAGKASMRYRATVRHLAGDLLGETSGSVRVTGMELINNSIFKSDEHIQRQMATECARELGRYIESLSIPAQ